MVALPAAQPKHSVLAGECQLHALSHGLVSFVLVSVSDRGYPLTLVPLCTAETVTSLPLVGL